MLGEVLRNIRIFYETTLTELSQEFDISQGYLSDIERGKKEPSLDVLKMYSEKFSIPLSGILFFHENINEPKRLNKFRKLLGRHTLQLIQFLVGEKI